MGIAFGFNPLPTTLIEFTRVNQFQRLSGVELADYIDRTSLIPLDIFSRVPGSGVRGRGSGEGETTASSLAGKEESSRKEDNSGQGKDGPAGAIAQGGNGQ